MSETRTAEQEGYAAHVAWESVRKGENECDAERRIRALGRKSADWWSGWLERSDEWREQMGYAAENGW